MSPEEYMETRIDDQISWYDRKSGINKKWCLRLEVITILGSACIPIISSLGGDTYTWSIYVVSILGVILTCVAGLMALMKYRENWIEYRTASEQLRMEKFLYLTRTGPYAGKNSFTILVETVETILASEVANWKNSGKSGDNEEGGAPQPAQISTPVRSLRDTPARQSATAPIPPSASEEEEGSSEDAPVDPTD